MTAIVILLALLVTVSSIALLRVYLDKRRKDNLPYERAKNREWP
jgi:hypothetical protein